MRALVLVLVTACRYTGHFECATDEQCTHGGVQGTCYAGSCAFVDDACAAGYRYGESAAEGLADRCLDEVAPADCGTWSLAHVDACDIPSPVGDLAISVMATYDTETGTLTPAAPHSSAVISQADGTMVRVISVRSLTVDATMTLRVRGTLPLVIASWGDITVAGTIAANSAHPAQAMTSNAGPGANPASCSAPAAGMDASADLGEPGGGAGGGGGGGFQGTGGKGGDGSYQVVKTGGAGGAAATMPQAGIRGGCPGGASGESMGMKANGGDGGGAIHLAARGVLTISGAVHAGGEGGDGGPASTASGGGGGGSGGWVGLDGASVTVSGVLAANGGGGGAAAGSVAGRAGGDAPASSTAASGGGAVDCNGDGAAGAAGTTLAGSSANSQARACGGGGGGGGAGVIWIRSGAPFTPGATATISPPALVDPR